MAGRHAALLSQGKPIAALPRETALGSLCHYITHAEAKTFQPANITFDLLPALDEESKKKFKHDKKARHAEVCRRAQAAFQEFLHAHPAPEFCQLSV
jgi:methylenetetrahydrofolate--tRNA-(uracil-5-)-methyltransferase